ncbi:MAG: ATPase, partial [Pseudomonadota bacterium]
ETSETQIKAFFGQIDETLSSFEDNLRRIENTMSTRFDTLKSQTESYRGEVVDAENQVIADLNERMALLQSETRAVSTKLRESEKEAMEQISLSKEHWKMEITAMLGSLTQLDRDRHAATQRQLKALYEEAKRVDERFKQHDAHFIEEVSRRQDEFETREAQATEVLAQRFAALDEMLEQRREAQAAETDKLVQQASSLGEQIEALSALIANVTQETETSRERIGEGVSLIAAQFEGEREAIEEAKGQLNELTEAGIRLLEIIQSGARHSREDLPAAIQTAIAELGTVEARAEEVSALMLSTNARSGELGEYLAKTNSQIAEADASLGALQSRLNEQSDEAMAKLNGLRSGLAKLTEASVSYAGDTQETLRSAIAQLDDASRNALVTLENGAAAKVSELAGKLSSEAVSSLERSLQSETAETIGKLEQSAAHASGVGREVTMQLRDQLVKVNELTANLEQRIARAHEKAREEVDNDFARRMALITDSLNSASIDISASLSSEVADTAWDAYLKGDRGIFTRRAVRLVDAAQAREIAELYQSDETFKTNVSRYIHDFESMLRAMLSTRDGNALSVTVLGSDMGKLYVALAQAIERFRK